MLDFRLDEEQQMLVEVINRFATEKLRTVFREAEESGEMPADVLQAGWEIGALPASIPGEYGGFGEHSAVTSAIATEEFSFGDLAITLQIMTPNLLAIPVMLAGTEAQKQAYLPSCVDTDIPKVTAALTERVYQFDPYNLGVTATANDDGYVLNGIKVYVPAAADAETILVWANEGGTTQGFLVATDTVGVTIGERDKLMGVQALATYEVRLDNVQISADAKLGGAEGCNFDLILNYSRVALGAAAVGVARASYEYAREYAKEREQFGRPIAQNQSIAFMLADMASDVESARLLVWEAAWLLDQGEDATQATTVMKQYVDDVVLRVCDNGVLILGGYGFIREYPAELWLRNARGFASFDGLAIA
ncbi:MAG: acyl-CoA dehydrogenase family protein [Chloroflexota bacterium]